MSDDELDRLLRAARPDTPAADEWADSSAGDRALSAIQRGARAAGPTRRAGVARLPHRLNTRTGRVGVALTGAAAIVAAIAVGVGVSGRGGAPPPTTAAGGPVASPSSAPIGPRPAAMALASYDTCAEALHGLRTQARAHVSAYLTQQYRAYDQRLPVSVQPAPPGSKKSAADPSHSRTNNQEPGADEPDVVKTDGQRIVSVSDGTLRVVEVASRKVAGSLDLTMYAGSTSAQLLVSGDRALVVLGNDATTYRVDYAGQPSWTGGRSTFVLVDLATPRPTVLSTLRPRGTFVDARLVDGRIRLLVSSAPHLDLPVAPPSTARATAAARAAIAKAPLSIWLPDYTVTTGSRTVTNSVPCTAFEHPTSYTGASMLTVYTVDPQQGFADVTPLTLAADGTTVYATTTSLYVTSGAFDAATTQLHRFDITRPGSPTYLGSGTVPGHVLDAYSLSDYRGSLRVVTTLSGARRATSTSVYALDADTLRVTGHVDGLGRGEQVFGVRFVGPLVYLVTFRQTDPLYVVDLSDPSKPRTFGSLKITGYSDYLHQTGPGRLLGVGAEATRQGEQTGAQVSLFDVSNPARPTRLDRILRTNSDTSDIADPHAFQYWSPTHTAFVPFRSYNSDDGRSTVLVVHVGTDDLRTVGVIDNPPASRVDYDTGIVRTLVIGDSIWTLSAGGLRVSSSVDLHQQAWIRFV